MASASLEEIQEALEHRREQLLEQFEASGGNESLRKEWVELLLERDQVLKLLVTKENERKLRENLAALLQLLITVGKFDHSQSPQTLKTALYNLYTELSAYVTTDDLALDPRRQTALPVPPPLPPVPPAPHSGTDCTPGNGERLPYGGGSKRARLEESGESPKRSPKRKSPKRLSLRSSSRSAPRSARRTPSSMSRRSAQKVTPTSPLVPPSFRKFSTPRVKSMPGAKYPPNTPQRPVDDEDLRRSLLVGRENLKSTPGVKRSPGGTPLKSKIPVYNSDNPSDMVSLALHKKFYNVRLLHASPVKDEVEVDSREASFNLSID